jgi:hypothetical protein
MEVILGDEPDEPRGAAGMISPGDGPGERRSLPSMGLVMVLLVMGWVCLMAGLMIAPVADECSILPPLDPGTGVTDNIARLWRENALFRPLPLALLAALQVVLGDPDAFWIIFRGLNICLLLASLACLLAFLQRSGCRSYERLLLFTVNFLFGGAAVICAAWFANIYDVATLFCLSLGLLLLIHERPWAAGIALGLAFFCKESAVLVVPFLGLLYLIGRERRRHTAQAAAVAGLLGLVYWLLRGQVMVLGSAADLHDLDLVKLIPTMNGLVRTFWGQSLIFPVWWLGYLSLVLSLAMVRRWLAALALLCLWLGSAVVYLGMMTPRVETLLHWASYSGRLFLVPVTLAALVLALYGRRAALWIIVVPGLLGGCAVYTRYLQLQQAYLQVYELAAQTDERLLVVHNATGGNYYSPRHRVRIGDFPEAEWELRVSDGALLPRAAADDGRPVRSAQVMRMMREQLRPYAHGRGGKVEELRVQRRNLHLRGWLPFADSERHQKVFLVARERPMGIRITTVQRPDVAARPDQEQMQYCGFEIIVSFRSADSAQRAAESICVAAESATSPLTLLDSDNPDCDLLLDE